MEQNDILDENGNKTGKTATRAEIHARGLWHKVVYVCVVNSKNEFLLQRRSLEKESGAGLWDISVGGHITAGQDDIETAVRETEEELGLVLKPQDLELLGTFKQSSERPGYINNEYGLLFIMRKDIDISKLCLQKSEVEAVKFVSLAELRKLVMSKDPSVVSHPDAFSLLFKALGV